MEDRPCLTRLRERQRRQAPGAERRATDLAAVRARLRCFLMDTPMVHRGGSRLVRLFPGRSGMTSVFHCGRRGWQSGLGHTDFWHADCGHGAVEQPGKEHGDGHEFPHGTQVNLMSGKINRMSSRSPYGRLGCFERFPQKARPARPIPISPRVQSRRTGDHPRRSSWRRDW